jgi:plasmid maintenance system killer protein
MIESFRHKGLRRLFEDDNLKGVNPDHVRKMKQILAVLHAAQTIEALDLPTFGLHPLKDDLKGFGPLQCVRIGESSSALRMAALRTLTLSTIIEGR